MNIGVGRDVGSSTVIEYRENVKKQENKDITLFNSYKSFLIIWVNAEHVKMSESKCLNGIIYVDDPVLLFLTAAPVRPQYQSGGHHRTDRRGHPEGRFLHHRGSFSCPKMTM